MPDPVDVVLKDRPQKNSAVKNFKTIHVKQRILSYTELQVRV